MSAMVKIGDIVIVSPRVDADDLTRIVLKGKVGDVRHVGERCAYVEFRDRTLASASHVDLRDLEPYEPGALVFVRA